MFYLWDQCLERGPTHELPQGIRNGATLRALQHVNTHIPHIQIRYRTTLLGCEVFKLKRCNFARLSLEPRAKAEMRPQSLMQQARAPTTLCVPD